MKRSHVFFFFVLLCSLSAENRWKSIDEGFRFVLPWDWQQEKVQGYDSHVGRYRGKTAYLEFDEFFGLGYTKERSQEAIDKLKSDESNPRSLKLASEVWHVNGRIARFSIGPADPRIYGHREFKNVARLFVPYAGEEGYLDVLIFYDSIEDVAVVRRILQSFEWKKQPNQPPEPMRAKGPHGSS